MRKKLNKILLSFVLVLVLTAPIFAGCDLFNGKSIVSFDIEGAITTYYLGEKLNIQDTKLNLIYDDNTSVKISADKNMITGFNTQTLGNKQMKVKYKGVERTIDYTVKFRLGKYSANLSNDTESQDFQIEFVENGKAYCYKNENNEYTIYPSSFTWKEENNNIVLNNLGLEGQIVAQENGTFTTTFINEGVGYANFSMQYDQSLQNQTSKKISNITGSGKMKTNYTLYENIDFENAKMIVTFEDNSTITVKLYEQMVSGFNTSTVGERDLTISLMGVDFNVTYTVNSFKLGKYLFKQVEYYKNQEKISIDREIYAGSGYVLGTSSGKVIQDNQVINNSGVSWHYDTNDRVVGDWTTGIAGGEFMFNVLTPTTLAYYIMNTGTNEYDYEVTIYEWTEDI